MTGFTLHGPWPQRLLSLAALGAATGQTLLQRTLGNSPTPDWDWRLETVVRFMRGQMYRAQAQPDIRRARQRLDSLVFAPPSPIAAIFKRSKSGEPRGRWILPRDAVRGRTLLYLHGGGYAFHPAAHKPLAAYVACAARARTLALDYRLTPEHPHPAQREDALDAYRWLLRGGLAPSDILLAGDGSGGRLLLQTLCALRGAGLPQPALGIALSPWTPTGHLGRSLSENASCDWLPGAMALRLDEEPDREGGSGMADLAGLAPLYFQAGRREILHDRIVDFTREARRQGAEISLDIWPDMPHLFQALGTSHRHSRIALARIGVMADVHLLRAAFAN